MVKYILGVEIECSNIKILECRRKGEQLIIEKAHKIPAPIGSVSNGMIKDVQQVYEAIDKVMKTNKYRSKNMIFLIKSTEIITREIYMPVMPKRDLDSILSLQYKDYLLVDLSKYQVAYKVIQEVKKDAVYQLELLIVAAPNTIIFPLLEVANKLKIKVIGINTASDALTRLFSRHNRVTTIQEDDVMVLDMNEKATTITIVSGGVGALGKDISFGTDSLNELATEIKKILQFYFSNRQKAAIEKIYIVGAGAYCNHIKEKMTHLFDIPCVSGAELKGGQVSFKEEFQEESAYFANLLGAVNNF